MAEMENVVILRVGTDEAVQSVQDLRDNIKVLKDQLNETTIGTQEYQDILSELKVNQNAVKEAMYATTSSLEEVSKSAKGLGSSYNSLVNHMAELKTEFRSTTDEARRAELGAEIKKINDQLKEMDAMQGNFQRNVGNYTASIRDAMKEIPPFAEPIKKGFEGIDKTMGLMSKNPLIAIISLLLPVLTKITSELKENETAVKSIDRAMAALKPVFDMVSKAIEVMAGWISKAVDYFVSLAGESGDSFKKIISGAIGVGNTLLQAFLTPLRTIVEAFKGLGTVLKDVFTGDLKSVKDDAETAFSGIKAAIVKGFSFKENFNVGKEAGEEFVKGLGSPRVKGAAKAAGQDVAKEFTATVQEAVLEDIGKISDEISRELDKEVEEANKKANRIASDRISAIDEATDYQIKKNSLLIENERERAEKEYEIQSEANSKKLELMQQFAEQALERGDLESYFEYEQEMADLSVQIELETLQRHKEINQQKVEDDKMMVQQRISIMQDLSSGVSSILGSISDMYEALSASEETAAKKMKAIKTAEAIIQTIFGAVSAFMGITAETGGWGVAAAAAQAAIVMAAGMANVAKIRATNIGSGGGSSVGSFNASVPMMSGTNAPVLTPSSSEVVGAKMVDTLNQINENTARSQRVYILDSDIQAKEYEREMIIKNTSF